MERPATLGDRSREQLRAAIMAGRFDPGAKLTIRSVAKALDVSLTPAREALYSLVSEGALEMGTNGTVFVPVLDEARVHELTVIRLALEGAAAQEAARYLDTEAVVEIRAINDELMRADAAGDYKRLMELNWAFHFAIYSRTGMPTLTRMIENCWLKTGSYLNVLYPAYGKTDRGIQNHADIIAALDARDGEALSAAVRIDIDYATKALLAAIRTRNSAKPVRIGRRLTKK